MNERERFEAWYASEATSSGVECTAEEVKKMRVDDYYGHERKYLNGCWDGWKACRADAMSWRPIESAPKDGTDWLGITASGGRVVFRRLDPESPDSINGAEFYESWSHDPIYTLIAWMPIPEPPK